MTFEEIFQCCDEPFEDLPRSYACQILHDRIGHDHSMTECECRKDQCPKMTAKERGEK